MITAPDRLRGPVDAEGSGDVHSAEALRLQFAPVHPASCLQQYPDNRRMGHAVRLGQYGQALTLGPALGYFGLLIR